MSDVSRAPPSRAPSAPRASAAPAAPSAAPVATEFEFSEAHKESLAGLAASMSFVGVCEVLLGLMSATFALGAGYSGYPGVAAGLAAGAAVCMPFGWWAMSGGRSLSALVRTRGRDVAHLMEAVGHLRWLFGFARVFIIVYALAAMTAGGAYVWCNFAVDKGGKCFSFLGG